MCRKRLRGKDEADRKREAPGYQGWVSEEDLLISCEGNEMKVVVGQRQRAE